jgi:mannose-6-phosphate isomerase-like protein (cupin superfamily)
MTTMSTEVSGQDEVKVIAARYVDRPKSDPSARCFVIKDHIIADPEKLKSGRMYVGDAFRAVVLTLMPGQGQKTHLHPSTDHAWFVVSGTAEMVMENGQKHDETK